METPLYIKLKMNQKIIVIDYGAGNLWSIASALRYLGKKFDFSNNPGEIIKADTIILPGVGSFRKAMHVLDTTGIADALREAVTVRQRKILGVCLGMQLFAQSSSEDGFSNGLGLIPGRIERFVDVGLGRFKVPHIGFNWVSPKNNSTIFAGLKEGGDFYFNHSYRLKYEDQQGCVGMCSYGEDFVAAYSNANIHATQFHPEKSQTNGLRLLTNFFGG
jgi:glutamine amidotransferase